MNDLCRTVMLLMSCGLILIMTGCAHKGAIPGQQESGAKIAHRYSADESELIDTTENFTDLRVNYATSGKFDVWEHGIAELLAESNKALDAQDFRKLFSLSHKILKKNKLHIHAHLNCAMAHWQLGDTAGANYHGAVEQKLIESILQSGDGKSEKSAFVIIARYEEPCILGYLTLHGYHLDPSTVKNAFIACDGHQYDILSEVDTTTNDTVSVYFNVDIPYKLYHKSH